jgi:hypothetical protein
MIFTLDTRRVMRAAHRFFIGNFLASLAACSAFAGTSVTLAWDPSTDATVKSYNLYYGSGSRSYSSKVNVGTTTASISNLVVGTTYYFAVTAQTDTGLESDYSSEVVFTPTASPLNQRPTLNAIADLLLQENNSAVTVALTGIGSGSATENQTLTLTAFSGSTNVIPHPSVAYTSPNSTGSLIIQPRAGASGSAIITVMVDDGGTTNNTVIQTFIVDVQPANLPPTIDAISNMTIRANSGLQTVTLTGIGPGSTNENQTVTLTASSSKPSLINPIVNSAVPAGTTATLSFAPATNSSGTATITVRADDGQPTNSITTRIFDVTVVRDIIAQTPLTNVTVLPYTTFRYALLNPFPAANKINYSLEPGAPDSARLNTRKGITYLTWSPSSAYASTTNVISVRSTDSANSAMTTNFLFVVSVLDYLSVNPGFAAVEAGQNVTLPLYGVSSDPLSNLTFTISWPNGRFSNPTLNLAPGSIFTSTLQLQGTNLQINLRAAAGKSFAGSNFLGNLNFVSLTNQGSAFIPMTSRIVTGTRPNNSQLVGLFPGEGEVVVVKDQPLLRSLIATNSARSLKLYGKVGRSYQVLYSTNMTANTVWQPLTTYTHTSVAQSLSVNNTAPVIFYRLKQQ